MNRRRFIANGLRRLSEDPKATRQVQLLALIFLAVIDGIIKPDMLDKILSIFALPSFKPLKASNPLPDNDPDLIGSGIT